MLREAVTLLRPEWSGARGVVLADALKDLWRDVFSEEVFNHELGRLSFYSTSELTPRLRIRELELSCGGVVASADHGGLAGCGVLCALLPGEFRCGLMIGKGLLDKVPSLPELVGGVYDGGRADILRVRPSGALVDKIFRDEVFGASWLRDAIDSDVARGLLKLKVAHIVRTMWRGFVDILVERGELSLGDYRYYVASKGKLDILALARDNPVTVIGVMPAMDGSSGEVCVIDSSLDEEETRAVVAKYVDDAFTLERIDKVVLQNGYVS